MTEAGTVLILVCGVAIGISCVSYGLYLGYRLRGGEKPIELPKLNMRPNTMTQATTFEEVENPMPKEDKEKLEELDNITKVLLNKSHGNI